MENSENKNKIDLEAFNLGTQKTKGQKLKDRIFLDEGETFEDPVLCSQCKGILVEPRNCQKCENYFCKECIEKTAQQNDGKCACGQIYKNEEPHKLINKMLSRLRFVCINEQEGCNEKITYENLDEHICPYEYIKCENEFCKKSLFRKDYQNHKKICPYKKITCEFCQANFFLSNLEQHQQTCEKKPIECPGCFQTFFQNQFQQHFQNCQEVEQVCENCSKKLKRKQMQNHNDVQCLYYYFLQKEERMNKNLTQLKKTIAYLNNRLVEEEQYFGTKCMQCEKYCCETSRKVCQICRCIYCIICSKKKIKNCGKCNSIICQNCNTGLDFCKICANKKKEENEKNSYLSSGRKRSKRGRPRKINQIIQNQIRMMDNLPEPLLFSLLYNSSGKELQNLPIQDSGFLCCGKEKLFFSTNLLECDEQEIILEIYKAKKYFFLKMQNYERFIQYQKIFQENFIEKLILFECLNRRWILNIGDFIEHSKGIYLLGAFQSLKDFDIIKHPELEGCSQISQLHRKSFYKNWDIPQEICVYCRKSDDLLFMPCDCKQVHLECFKQFFQRKRSCFKMEKCVKISVEDYFCDQCQKFYCWQAKSNKSRKMLIHCPEFDMKKDYLLFVKYSHKNLDKKKLSLIYIQLPSKKAVQYKDKFSFEKRRFQNEKVIISFRKQILTISDIFW